MPTKNSKKRARLRSKPKSLGTLLYLADDEVGAIIKRARNLDQVRQAILEILPQQAIPYVHIADISERRLCIHVSHSGWATRLRYLETTIRQALVNQFDLYVRQVQIKVRPGLQPQKQRRITRRMSTQNRQYMRSVAKYVEDKKLHQALERLANALENNSAN